MKITDYQKVQTLDESNIVLIDGNNGTTGMLLKRQICRKQVLTGNSYGRPGLTSTQTIIHLKWLHGEKMLRHCLMSGSSS